MLLLNSQAFPEFLVSRVLALSHLDSLAFFFVCFCFLLFFFFLRGGVISPSARFVWTYANTTSAPPTRNRREAEPRAARRGFPGQVPVQPWSRSSRSENTARFRKNTRKRERKLPGKRKSVEGWSGGGAVFGDWFSKVVLFCYDRLLSKCQMRHLTFWIHCCVVS